MSGMSGEHDAVRRLIGGYVLGGLDDDDQSRVDAHLSGCPACRAEVERLAPVPELLQRLPAGQPPTALEPPSQNGLDALLHRARRPSPRDRRRRAGLLAGAAAGVALVAAGSFLWPRSAPVPREGAPQQQQPAVQQQQPSSSGGGSAPAGTVVQFIAATGSALSGRATLTPRQWGVSVALEVTGLPGDGPFVLRVVGRGGQEEQAACWGRTTSASARVTGASSIQLPNVDKVTVSDHDGHLLGTAAQN
ncbi:zf-HC2 domain-containing protein [Dactylosporangium sp. NPDC005555]|uniref:anti-sigma factor family protein n=1 Tax=Dactylosporangium sp. NPDC005555 TaxID=3154889 RepID=UPI0033B8663F